MIDNSNNSNNPSNNYNNSTSNKNVGHRSSTKKNRKLGAYDEHIAQVLGCKPNRKPVFKVGRQKVSLEFVHRYSLTGGSSNSNSTSTSTSSSSNIKASINKKQNQPNDNNSTDEYTTITNLDNNLPLAIRNDNIDNQHTSKNILRDYLFNQADDNISPTSSYIFDSNSTTHAFISPGKRLSLNSTTSPNKSPTTNYFNNYNTDYNYDYQADDGGDDGVLDSPCLIPTNLSFNSKQSDSISNCSTPPRNNNFQQSTTTTTTNNNNMTESQFSFDLGSENNFKNSNGGNGLSQILQTPFTYRSETFNPQNNIYNSNSEIISSFDNSPFIIPSTFDDNSKPNSPIPISTLYNQQPLHNQSSPKIQETVHKEPNQIQLQKSERVVEEEEEDFTPPPSCGQSIDQIEEWKQFKMNQKKHNT